MFENTLIGRVLPRGQRYVDIADEAVREDPGFERAALNAWERAGVDGDDSDPGTWDWDAFEDLVYEVMPEDLEVELVDELEEPVPDVVVWVNGVPLEAGSPATTARRRRSWTWARISRSRPWCTATTPAASHPCGYCARWVTMTSAGVPLTVAGERSHGCGGGIVRITVQPGSSWRRAQCAPPAAASQPPSRSTTATADDWLDDGWHKHDMWAACRGCEALLWRMEREGGF